MKISERDKLIVKWFGLFLVVVGIWFLGIDPFNSRVNALAEEKTALETRKTIAEATLLEEAQIARQEAEAVAAIQARFERYTLFASADEVEAFLIPIILPYNVRFTYFGVTQPALVTPVTTLKTRSDYSYRLKSLVEDYQALSTPLPELPTTQSNLVQIKVTYVVAISFEDFQLLITDIEALDRALLLSEAIYDFGDGVGELTFDVYMSKQPDFAG